METAEYYVNLIVSYLRHKPYTDCRGNRKHLNGKSKLEAARVHPASKDWPKNSLKSPCKSNRNKNASAIPALTMKLQ